MPRPLLTTRARSSIIMSMMNLKRLSSAVYLIGAAVLMPVSMAGCDSLNPEANVTYVVVTDTPNVTQPPTLPPEPTITPTPDVPPDALLQTADRQFHNGQYAPAAENYRRVLVDSRAAPEQRAHAAFQQGRALHRAGDFQGAVSALTILIDSFAQDERAAQAYFLRADAYVGLSRWTEAINDYRQYLRLRPGLIDSYVHERIGDAFIGMQFFADSLASYNQAVQSGRASVPLLALREKLARVYASAGDVTNAITQYDAILQAAQNEPYRAQIEYAAAQALVENGQLDVGLSRMQRIFNNYPAQPAAYEAMNILIANGRELDAYQRGRILFFRQEYAAAIDAFNEYTATVPLSEIPPELHLLLGRAYREVGNAPAALVAFETILKQYPTSELIGDALLEQGRTRFLNGQTAEAIAFYLQIVDSYGYLQTAGPQALWRAGYLFSQQGDYEQSRRTFLRLAEQYPTSPDAVDGLGIAAADALKQGDVAAAEQLYAQQAALATGDAKASANLIVGKLALARGDASAADALNAAAAAAPDTFFAARARDLVSGALAFTPPAQIITTRDEAQEIADAEAWIRARFAVTQEGSFAALSPTLAADPRLVRGRELWVMGLTSAAYDEFYALLDATVSDPVASLQLAIHFRDLGVYTPSMQAAANIITAAGVGTLDAPGFIARLRYPLHYWDLIQEVSTRNRLDPLLVASLIRHESLFNTYATAAAGEKGLMQVIPPTAEYIAERIAWPDYQNTDLFRPHMGIEFGAYYLSEQLATFDGVPHVALSGYNAGPGRAITWRQAAGDDFDTYLDAITISSTRLYVQLIYRNYAIYKALYGG